jgi:hypothetical protein
MKTIRLFAMATILLGGATSLAAQPQNESPFGFCTECRLGATCGDEESICASKPGCSTGMATCAEFGSCQGSYKLITCNTDET